MTPTTLTRILTNTKKIHLDYIQLPSTSLKIGILSFHDPARLNALDVEMGKEFQHAIQHINNDGHFSALVIRGFGNKAFSAGGDLAFLRDRTNSSPHINSKIMREFYARFLCIRETNCPTIAAINGAAVGAGLGVALACDLRIVAGNAKIGVTFTKLGLHPGMGTTHYLPLVVGNANATDLLLSGRLVTGKKFYEMGGALDCISNTTSEESDSTVHRAIELAQEIASSGPLAVRATTLTLRLKQDESLHRSLQREADAQAQSYASKDLKEGVEATAEKRKPIWADN
jgi:enoyl-CoA hydratase